jgi:hypothetical protein
MTEFTKSSEEPKEEPKAKTAVNFSQPSKELAARLLGKVSFKERLIGSIDHPGPGPSPHSMYSFAEAAVFLDGGDLSGQDHTYTVRFDILKKWIDETLGDKELAQAIEEIAKEVSGNWKAPYQQYLRSLELIKPIQDLMMQRLKQCKMMMGIEFTEGELEALGLIR